MSGGVCNGFGHCIAAN